MGLVLVFLFPVGCWEKSKAFDDGTHYGFTVGESKRSCFDFVREAQTAGRVSALGLLDQPPGTYAERYKGYPVYPEDFARVEKVDRWKVGLTECNCWLVLSFEGDTLSRIEWFEWTGPVK